MVKCDKLRAITGQHLMFIGTNSKTWTTGQFTDCAAWCQRHQCTRNRGGTGSREHTATRSACGIRTFP